MADFFTLSGSVPDVVGLSLGLSSALSPEKGFAYNLCSFVIRLDASQDQLDKSTYSQQRSGATTPNTLTQPDGSAAIRLNPPDYQISDGPVIFEVKYGSDVVAQVGIKIISTATSICGVLELRQLEGYDTSIGDNISIEAGVIKGDTEFSANDTLLIIKGLIHPAGYGYAHFIGGLLIRAVANSGSSKLKCNPLFMTQAPRTIYGNPLKLSIKATYDKEKCFIEVSPFVKKPDKAQPGAGARERGRP